MPRSMAQHEEPADFDNSKAYVAQEEEGKAFVDTPYLVYIGVLTRTSSSTTAER